MSSLQSESICKDEPKKKSRHKFYPYKHRLSLKYSPEIMKIVCKMRQCIKKKNLLLVNLKRQLKAVRKKVESQETSTQTNLTIVEETGIQTDMLILGPAAYKTLLNIDTNKTETASDAGEAGWSINKDSDQSKSIAEQVKEVAQSALQDTGMVYIESVGMYYDYKTGYYYNSELGLYYHTDTHCYYYYSNEKECFVFHSYPDRSAEILNPGLLAHEKKKAKKHKQEWEHQDDINNLMESFSQGKEDDASIKSKRKKRKIVGKKNNKKDSSVSDDEAVNGVPDESKPKTESVKIDIFESGAEKDLKKTVEVEELKKETETAEKVEVEDGECSDSESEVSAPADDNTYDSSSSSSDDDFKNYPPCMRVIVKQTSLSDLRVGTLFIVTKDGGSIGREGYHHTIILDDDDVSKNHLIFTYSTSKKVYLAMDLGSRTGTKLNGVRMSPSKTVSNSMEVEHGSFLIIGDTTLVCHIHKGNDTCGQCEPGLIMDTVDKQKRVAYTRTCSVQKQHRLELARLKNKYAPKQLAIEETAYNDRAKARRETVGSSHHAEKTQSSDMDTFINPENKGFKLLEKMGWTKGEGLGKDNQGNTEPIPILTNDGKAGLGTGMVSAPKLNIVTNTKKLGSATLRLASKTNILNPPAKAFQVDGDEEEE